MINLTKWNVWSNYTSFFINELELEKVVNNLVESGLCQFAFHSHSNKIVWTENNTIKDDILIIDHKEYSKNAIIKFPEELKEYHLECAFQAGKLKFFENNILHEFVDIKFDYIRAFMSVIVISLKETEIMLYPQFKIWGNGVFSLLFRILSPSKTIDEDFLIDNYVNLYNHNTSDIYFPPKVIELNAIEHLSDYSLKKKNKLEFDNVLGEIRKKINEKSILVEDSEFDFTVCPTNIDFDEIEDKHNFMSIVSYMFNALSASINQLYIKGRTKKNMIGDFWIGRPQVMILDFIENNLKSTDNNNQFAVEFSKILTRTSKVTQKLVDNYFHNSLRIYEDYSCFLNQGIGLWVYSKEGLESNKEYADLNNGHLVYPLQVQAELMDYLYLSYKQLYELAKLSPLSFDFLIHLKGEYHSLNEVKNNVSSYGEIQELYSYFYSKVNIEYWEKSFNEIVELKKEVVKDKRANLYNNIALLLSLIFGLVGILSFSIEVLKPIWFELKLWIPQIKSTENLFFFLLASFLFLALLIVLTKVFKYKKWV